MEPQAISNFAHCEALVREADPDRYWASVFAPADKRPYLHALYAFNFEIARVRESVREALVGEIRLQWWRDALQGEARGDVRSNPIAAALDDTIVQFRLPRQSLVDLIDARIFDLYDDPMPNLNDLEGYCGETSSSLIQISSVILANGSNPGTADAAGHAGVAYAITGLLRAFPHHARQGQVYVPADILARHGVVREDIVTGRGGPIWPRGCRAASFRWRRSNAPTVIPDAERRSGIARREWLTSPSGRRSSEPYPAHDPGSPLRSIRDDA